MTTTTTTTTTRRVFHKLPNILLFLRSVVGYCSLILLLVAAAYDDDTSMADAFLLQPPPSIQSSSLSSMILSCNEEQTIVVVAAQESQLDNIATSSSLTTATHGNGDCCQGGTIGDDNWITAKTRLEQCDCCVVSITGLDSHLKILQQHFALGGGATLFNNVDLRARVRILPHSSSSSSLNPTTITTTYKDCLEICRAVRGGTATTESIITNNVIDPCAMALQELARGISFMDPSIPSSVSSLKNTDQMKDVFVRVVIASTYQANDPPFHTDKAIFRGYVTLCGLGTDYMTCCCSSPLEYLSLRSMGTTLPTTFWGDGNSSNSTLRRTPNLEFIVMKGDYYYNSHHHHYQQESSSTDAAAPSSLPFWRTSNNLFSWQQRQFACVHRSPPANGHGERRVIISFDLADGDDDREWYVVNKKRTWRNGLTQRKSKLVA